MLQLLIYHFGLKVSTNYLDDNKLEMQPKCNRTDNGDKAANKTSGNSSCLDLTGNPLDMNEICNLSVIDNQMNNNLTRNKIPIPVGLFDYSRYHCIWANELPNAYTKYGSGDLLAVIGDEGAPQLVSLFPGDSPMTRRYLKIKTDQHPNLNVTVHGDLLTRYMPFSQQTQISFEADYDFPFSAYHTKFPNASLDRPLAAPPDDVIGVLTTTIKPYSSETPLPRLKEDIDRIKRLCWAYQSEEPWIPVSTFKKLESNDFEQLVVDKLNAANGKHEVTSPMDGTYSRDLDDTERMWQLLKDVPDRKTATSGFKFALSFFRENRINSSTIGAYDFTEFVKMIRRPGVTSNFEVLGLKMLIETGFYKVTNDCLHVIRSVSPELSDNFAVKYLLTNEENVKMSIERRMLFLHHLYKLACLTSALLSAVPAVNVETAISSPLMTLSESETEWEGVMVTEVFELLQVVFTHACRIPVSSLVAVNPLDPRMWTVHFSSKMPIRIEKRLVYESIHVPDGTPVYCCHILELFDTVWLYDN